MIGSGISGLLTAELVLGSMPTSKVLVVEKSTQIGGRAKIISQNSPFDLGGAWTWSDQRLNALTKRLGIEKFKQPSDGVDVILQVRSCEVESPVRSKATSYNKHSTSEERSLRDYEASQL